MKKFKYLIICAVVLMSVQCNDEEGNKNLLTFEVVESFTSADLIVNAILVDSKGVNWFGTDKGLYSLKDEEWVKYTGAEFTQVITSLAMDNNGKIFSGTKSGVVLISGSYGSYENGGSYSTSNSGLPSNKINTINLDYKARQWYGTEPGVICNDNGAWSSEVLDKDDDKAIQSVIADIKESNISSIAFVNDHYFFATLGKNLYNLKYDSGLDAITGASWMTADFTGKYTTDSIFCVIGDVDEFVWFGSNTGLTKTHKSLTQEGDGFIEYFLDGERVFSLLEASNGNIWAGSNNGVSKYAGGSWTNYTTADGISSNTVYAIAQESNGNIWIGTDKGISRFDGSNWKTY